MDVIRKNPLKSCVLALFLGATGVGSIWYWNYYGKCKYYVPDYPIASSVDGKMPAYNCGSQIASLLQSLERSSDGGERFHELPKWMQDATMVQPSFEDMAESSRRIFEQGQLETNPNAPPRQDTDKTVQNYMGEVDASAFGVDVNTVETVED